MISRMHSTNLFFSRMCSQRANQHKPPSFRNKFKLNAFKILFVHWRIFMNIFKRHLTVLDLSRINQLKAFNLFLRPWVKKKSPLDVGLKKQELINRRLNQANERELISEQEDWIVLDSLASLSQTSQASDAAFCCPSTALAAVLFGAGVVAQLVEWSLPKPEICGSNPNISKILVTNCTFK